MWPDPLESCIPLHFRSIVLRLSTFLQDLYLLGISVSGSGWLIGQLSHTCLASTLQTASNLPKPCEQLWWLSRNPYQQLAHGMRMYYICDNEYCRISSIRCCCYYLFCCTFCAATIRRQCLFEGIQYSFFFFLIALPCSVYCLYLLFRCIRYSWIYKMPLTKVQWYGTSTTAMW